jgi:hypothetical protein
LKALYPELAFPIKRHGTTMLFAARDVLEGKVIGRCTHRHRHQEFIRFLNAIEAQVPARKFVHVILDNYTDLVLVAQRSRGVLRQTCQAATEARCLRRVVDLQATINRRSVAETNHDPKSFTWQTQTKSSPLSNVGTKC